MVVAGFVVLVWFARFVVGSCGLLWVLGFAILAGCVFRSCEGLV